MPSNHPHIPGRPNLQISVRSVGRWIGVVLQRVGRGAVQVDDIPIERTAGHIDDGHTDDEYVDAAEQHQRTCDRGGGGGFRCEHCGAGFGFRCECFCVWVLHLSKASWRRPNQFSLCVALIRASSDTEWICDGQLDGGSLLYRRDMIRGELLPCDLWQH